MNVTPISGTNNITPVEEHSNVELVIPNTKTNVPNLTQWLNQEAFMLDVINAFQSFGFNLVDNLGVNNSTNNILSTNVNLSKALNNFVLSLQASLSQASTTNQSGEPNAAGNPNAEQEPPTQGFNNFATDLLLLSLLNTNNSLISGSTNNINSNPLLQSNFDTLLNVLTPLSPNVTTVPTLNDFFNMMINNLQTQINNQNNLGTSFSTAV